MGEDPQKQKREVGGRFQASTTLDDVLGVFDNVRGPVVTSTDVAQACDCSAKTARRKLDELADQNRVEGRETAGRTVWWRVDDEGEIVTDGGGALVGVRQQ